MTPDATQAISAALEEARRGLRASRDRRGERDAEIVRDLAVAGLQALERVSGRACDAAALLETFRETANPRTLAEANEWSDQLATELERFVFGDEAHSAGREMSVPQ